MDWKAWIRKMWKPIIGVIVSTAILGLGVVCFIYAKLGGDSLTAFEEGLTHVFGIRMGVASFACGVIIIIIDLLIARDKIGWTSIVNNFATGYFINLFENMFGSFLTGKSLIFRIIIFACGMVLIALSLVILIRYQQGMNPMDAIAWKISETKKVQYKYVRIVMDATLLLLGFIMGATIGVGSVVAAFGLGPLVSFMNNLINKPE